jgi:serine phosphatase RsbU (regulator of sigma subunit)/PAS domain-containing protein
MTEGPRSIERADQAKLADDRFRLALDSLLDLVTIQRSVRDRSGRTVDFIMDFVNHPELPVGDMARSELVGRRLLELLPELAGTAVFGAMVRVADSRQAASVDDLAVTVQRTDETDARYATVQIAPFGDGIIVVQRDVTERHHHIRRIEQVNAELAAAQQLAHIGIWRVDLDEGQMTLSDEAGRILGRAGGGVVPWAPGLLLDLVDPSDRQRVSDLIGSADGGSFMTETELRLEDGRSRLVAVVGQFVARDDQTDAVVWGTIQDVTEQRSQERALRDARDHLQLERATVAHLQQVIVPTLPDDEIEVGATYWAAGDSNLVGGDWYDAFQVGDDRIVLAVGDVAGHGLPAAALMSQLRNAVRGLAFADHEPDEVLTALNRLIAESGGDELATCVVGSFDRATAELMWASAGHPPVLVLPPGEPPAFLEGVVAPPLGFPLRVSGEVNRVTLSPGTLLVLYSDGLVERRGESLDIGFERLVRMALLLENPRPQQLCDHLVEAMLSETDLRDDVCVLAFRVPEARRLPDQ